MCQYWKHFKRRIKEMPDFLSLPSGLKIKHGIGLFHVHGHVKECFARYAPTFIQGAGMIDGEVVETLWNPLNHTSSSARAMTWYHRQEYLDAHMGDSNWLKMVGIGMLTRQNLGSLHSKLTVCSVRNIFEMEKCCCGVGGSPGRL